MVGIRPAHSLTVGQTLEGGGRSRTFTYGIYDICSDISIQCLLKEGLLFDEASTAQRSAAAKAPGLPILPVFDDNLSPSKTLL